MQRVFTVQNRLHGNKGFSVLVSVFWFHCTFTDAFTAVRVTNQTHPNASASHYLNRYWTVTESGISEFNCDTTFHYNAADVLGDESLLRAAKYDGGLWLIGDSFNTSLDLFTMSVDSFSDFTGLDSPTAVSLASFEVNPFADRMLVNWQTVYEIDLLGFNVLRSTSNNGTWIQLNDELIPAQAFGGVGGGTYEFIDQGVLPGETYYYWLQPIEAGGALNPLGPVDAQAAYPLFLPLVTR